MIQVNRIYLIFNRLVTKKFLVDTSVIISFTRKKIRNLPESFRTILSEKGFMAKILIARGQATIYVQKDGYTITQSLGEYVFPADDTGKILSSVTLTSTVR